MNIDWKNQGKRPPLDVCRVRKDGTPNTGWPSWYARDLEQAQDFVRSNRLAHGPRDYPSGQQYAVIVAATREELCRFTVKEAMEAAS